MTIEGLVDENQGQSVHFRTDEALISVMVEVMN